MGNCELKAIVWNSTLETGIETIDGQHKELLQYINELVLAIAKGDSESNIRAALSFLKEYVRNHFRTEENYMSRSNFPRADEHVIQHENFEKMVGEKEKI